MTTSAQDQSERVAQHIQSNPEILTIAERCIRQTYTRTAAGREFVEIMVKNLSQPTIPTGEKFTQKAFKIAMRESKAQPGSALFQDKNK